MKWAVESKCDLKFPGRVNNQNVPNKEDDDIFRDELDRQNADNVEPKNRRLPQRAWGQRQQAVLFYNDYEDETDMDWVGATGVIVPPPLALGAKFNNT
ncbi:hypothetical protein HAX54_041898, partial [Datura stramonium]|nr:hypothetical protein [Datura stramonium]